VRCIARVNNKLISGSFDGQMKFWDPWTGKCLDTKQIHKTCVNEIEIFPDKSRIVTTSAHHRATIWDGLDFNRGFVSCLCSETTVWVNGLVVLNGIIYTANGKGQIQVWNGDNGKLITLWEAHNAHIWKMKSDGNLLYTVAYNGEYKAWNLQGACVMEFDHPCKHVLYAMYLISPYMVTGDKLGFINLWDIRNGKLVDRWKSFDKQICALKLTKDRILAGAMEKTIKIWDYKGTLLQSVDISSNTIWCIDAHYQYFM